MAENGRRVSVALSEEKQTQGIVALVLALASGDSVKDAARLANVSERTVYRRLRNESFARRVNQARTAMLQQAVGRLASAVPKASAVLDKLLDSRSERIRLQAAKAIMDSSVKLGDAVAYEQRLASMEAMLNMRLPKRERQKNRDDRRQ
jgi:soluble lytic murein transglycosylase-like protein